MHAYLQQHPALLAAVRRLEQLNPDQFELYFQHRVSTRIESKDFQVDALSKAEDVGLAIRVIKDKRLGFSFTTSLEKDAIHQACESALAVAQFMPEDEHVGLYSFGASVYPNVDAYDIRGLQLPVNDKIELAKHLEGVTRKADPRVKAIRSASLSENRMDVHLVDSHGEHIQHQSTLYSASVTCKAEQDGDAQMGGEYGFSNFYDQLNVEEVGGLAARWATELLGAKGAPTMQCPAVFRNSVVGDLLDFISASFSAENIDKGRSMLAGKQGSAAFSEKVTIVDDGLLPGGFATSPFDGEGVPSRRTTLVDGGFVSNALYDGYYARKHDKEPTGSSVRGIKGPPSIGFSNLFLQPGRKEFGSLLDGIDRGVLITDLMGVHTANPVTGDFSLGASGILIENGKLTRPVKGFAVAGNVLEVFRRVTDIGNDLRFFGNVGAPSIRVREISVGGA